jgi:hypothetical protein
VPPIHDRRMDVVGILEAASLLVPAGVSRRKQAGVAGVGKRRTLTRLTPYGRGAFARHASALERIAATARAMRTADSEED